MDFNNNSNFTVNRYAKLIELTKAFCYDVDKYSTHTILIHSNKITSENFDNLLIDIRHQIYIYNIIKHMLGNEYNITIKKYEHCNLLLNVKHKDKSFILMIQNGDLTDIKLLDQYTVTIAELKNKIEELSKV